MVEVYASRLSHAAQLAVPGKVQVNIAHIYSYQGQDKPFARPEDWGCEVRVAGNGPYNAHPGDTLVCIGTADRYGYVARLGLRYHEVETVEEAKTILASLS